MVAILKWMFVLVLLIAVAGGGAAYWFYTRSDEGLRQAVLEHIKTLAPTLKIDIARAHFESMGRVRIYGMTVTLPGDSIDRPSLDVPEVIATLDAERLEDLEFVLLKLTISKPKLRLIRNLDGQWNWLQAAFKPAQNTTPISIEVENASVSTEFQTADNITRLLSFENFNLSARPEDSNHLAIRIATHLSPLLGSSRPIMLELTTAMDGSTWKCESHESCRIPVNQKLLQFFCDLSPDVVGSRVKELQRLLDKNTNVQTSNTVAVGPIAASAPSESRSNQSNVVSDFGARCEFEVNFRVEKVAPNQPLDFAAKIVVANGEINNALFPFSLSDLGGEIRIDSRKIIVSALKAANGETTIEFDGDIVPGKPMTATIKVRNVELNGAIKSRLPEGLRKVVQQLGLTGVCNADAIVGQSEDGWNYQVDLYLDQGTLTHERFPLTVRNVSGELHIKDGVLKRGQDARWHNQGGLLTFHGVGKHAGQSVNADGIIRNLGPEQDAQIIVTGDNLPVDDESLAACPPPVRKSIEALNLKGRHNVHLSLRRLPGPEPKWYPELTETVYDGQLSFNGFPYAIQKLRGVVVWKGDLVSFKAIEGVHNGATLKAAGTFRRATGADPGKLNLEIIANEAMFDRSLELALPENLKRVWRDFQPKGVFDAITRIEWIPGAEFVVRLPEVRVRNGEILMSWFPWQLQQLTGRFEYNTDDAAPGKLIIDNVRARHESTDISVDGTGLFNGRDPWRVKFRQLDVVNLIPDSVLRQSLPDSLRRTFDALSPTGSFSVSGPVRLYEQRGQAGTFGAQWDLQTVMSECAIQAGRRIDSINGKVRLIGGYDGSETMLKGNLDIDSLWVFRQPSNQGYQITKVRGPIQLADQRFVAGIKPAVLMPQLEKSPDETLRVRGDFINGTVFLDAEVGLNNELDYNAFVELKRGRLESFAQQYLRAKNSLAGITNGYVLLKGKGTDTDQMQGQGKLVIAPAAMVDSWFIVQLIQLAVLQVPDQAVFERADVEFKIANSRFDLNRIELQGDALSVAGLGYVRFDGTVQMDLGVYLRQWFGNNRVRTVKVGGTVGDPKAKEVRLLDLDKGVQQFFRAFDPRNMTPPRSLFEALGQKAEASGQLN